jgi:transcriptional regulator with XRE-family HTH domain
MKKKNPDQDTRITKISQFIRNWRMNEMINMSDLARMTGTHPNTIHNLESGKNITVRTLFNCLDALGISFSDVFENTL